MSVTYQVGPEFHAGDSLKAYPVSSWPYPTSDGPDGVAPTIAATETATVASDSTVTFSSLAAGTAYWVGTGSTPYPYLRIVTPATPSAGAAIAAGNNNIGDVDVATLPSSSTATLTNVASSATNVTLIASNAVRKGLLIFNDSTAVLYVKFGTTASATSYTVQIAAGGYWEMPADCVYTGRVDGIWASANGNARITEL